MTWHGVTSAGPYQSPAGTEPVGQSIMAIPLARFSCIGTWSRLWQLTLLTFVPAPTRQVTLCLQEPESGSLWLSYDCQKLPICSPNAQTGHTALNQRPGLLVQILPRSEQTCVQAPEGGI